MISFGEKVLFTEKSKLQNNVLNLNLFCKNSDEPRLYQSMHFMGLHKHGEGINGSYQDVTLGPSTLVALEGVWERVLFLEHLCIISPNATSIDYFGTKTFKDKKSTFLISSYPLVY